MKVDPKSIRFRQGIRKFDYCEDLSKALYTELKKLDPDLTLKEEVLLKALNNMAR